MRRLGGVTSGSQKARLIEQTGISNTYVGQTVDSGTMDGGIAKDENVECWRETGGSVRCRKVWMVDWTPGKGACMSK